MKVDKSVFLLVSKSCKVIMVFIFQFAKAKDPIVNDLTREEKMIHYSRSG